MAIAFPSQPACPIPIEEAASLKGERLMVVKRRDRRLVALVLRTLSNAMRRIPSCDNLLKCLLRTGKPLQYLSIRIAPFQFSYTVSSPRFPELRRGTPALTFPRRRAPARATAFWAGAGTLPPFWSPSSRPPRSRP